MFQKGQILRVKTDDTTPLNPKIKKGELAECMGSFKYRFFDRGWEQWLHREEEEEMTDTQMEQDFGELLRRNPI